MDRQSALVNQKLDCVKEYLQWRQTPRDLAIRIKRYYEHFYAKLPVFDETQILKNLPPSLNRELLRSFCKDTLGRIPLFNKLAEDFQTRIFPLLKPLVASRNEIVYRSGAAADTLFFIVDGEPPHPTPHPHTASDPASSA
jgi:hypothetical protein